MKVAIDTSSLENIADSIRLKNGLTTEYKPSEMASAIDNLPSGGADLGDYFTSTISAGDSSSVSGVIKMLKTIPDDTIVNGTSLNNAFNRFQGTTIPLLNTSNVTSMTSMFANATNLTTIPLLNTSSVTHIGSMFQGCTNLVNVPVLDLSSVIFMRIMFSNCPNLSDTSLDNILQMCIGATSYSSTKTLAFLGFTSTDYPTSRIEALPHYSAFTSAGWTIGY